MTTSTRAHNVALMAGELSGFASVSLAAVILGAFLPLFVLTVVASGCRPTSQERVLAGKKASDLRILGEAQLTLGAYGKMQSLIAMEDGFLLVRYFGGGETRFDRGKIWAIDLGGSAKMLADENIPWGRIPSPNMVAVSPDGNSAAYVMMEGDDNFIDVIDLKSGAKRRLLKDAGTDPLELISWTRDGRILFKRDFYLWQISADGSKASQITGERLIRQEGDAGFTGEPSPDGTYIVYHRAVYPPGVTGQAPLTFTYQLESVSDRARVAIDGFPAYPTLSLSDPPGTSWSPDNAKLLIARLRSGVYSLVALDVESGTETVLLEDIQKLGGVRAAWAWSPDGSLLALAPRAAYGRGGGLYLLDVDRKGSLAMIGDSAKEYSSLRWLPDGSGILFTRGKDVWIAILDPGEGSRKAAQQRLKSLQANPWPIVPLQQSSRP